MFIIFNFIKNSFSYVNIIFHANNFFFLFLLQRCNNFWFKISYIFCSDNYSYDFAIILKHIFHFFVKLYLVTPNASIIQQFNRSPLSSQGRPGYDVSSLPVQPRRGESGDDELIWQATCNCENNVDLRLEWSQKKKKTRLSSLSSVADRLSLQQLYANDQAWKSNR